jgi:hypothetical protein
MRLYEIETRPFTQLFHPFVTNSSKTNYISSLLHVSQSKGSATGIDSDDTRRPIRIEVVQP